MHNMKVLLLSLVSFVCVAVDAQKYDDIYDELPNLSLDQAYSKLLDFQKKYPYFANTYIQLGMICEHKMNLSDPLRDINSAQFWSENAHLFFGNFNVFYKEGDLRSNDVYYENLNIPFEGKKLKEEDLKHFVDAHEATCRNFRDTTMMIYTAIAKSKMHYNRCIKTFMAINEKYANYNELLLGYNNEVDKAMQSMANDIDSCVIAFGEYQRLIEAFPLLAYRQRYVMKDIQTFRLDGLTNSDFYENEFFMWDYKKWIDEYRGAIENAIKPLRREIDNINAMYSDGKKELESGKALQTALKQPYDEFFVFKLGKYDNSSLVRELFSYLEARRQYYVFAGDSLTLNTDTVPALMGRKMRHLYNTAVRANDAKEKLKAVDSYVTEDRVARFAEFFEKKYGGLSGLHSLQTTEPVAIDDGLSKVFTRFVEYVDALAAQDSLKSFVDERKSNAVPAIEARDEINDIVRSVINNEDSSVAFCVVDSLGKHDMLLPVGAVAKVSHIQNVNDGAIVIGTSDDGVVVLKVKDDASVAQRTVLPGSGMSVKALFRASAQEVCLFLVDADNKPHFVSVNTDAVLKTRFL